MSESERLIGVCMNPHGDHNWFPAESDGERCVVPECDCQPAFYHPAANYDRVVEELEKERELRRHFHGKQQDEWIRAEAAKREIERLREACRVYEQSGLRAAGRVTELREALREIWTIAEASEGPRMRIIEQKAATLTEPEEGEDG